MTNAMHALGQPQREEGRRLLKYDRIWSNTYLRRLYLWLANEKLSRALIEWFSYFSSYAVIYLQ